MTRLDIINDMLAGIGTAPLDAPDTQHPFYLKANTKLGLVDADFQDRGWWFNRSKRTLMASPSGEVIAPSNAVHLDPVDTSAGYVLRRGKLYDPSTGSTVIGCPVECWVVERLDIADLPPPALQYLRAAARFAFYVDEDGNEPKLSIYAASAERAMQDVNREHLKNADVNFFGGAANRWYRSRRGNTIGFPPYH